MEKFCGYSKARALAAGLRAVLPAAAALVLLASEARAQGRSERDVKCLFFVTLARYTEFPAEAFASEKAPVVLGVIGEDPFGAVLDSMTKNEKVRDRAIRVRRFASAEEVKDCHVLFFGPMSVLRREVELSRMLRRPVLTVSDVPGFASSGGMVEMYVNEEKKVRLRVSKGALERAHLSISPSILRRADEVASSIEWIPEGFSPWITDSERIRQPATLMASKTVQKRTTDLFQSVP